ncbi:MAG: OmpA family protein [Gallionella sp.]
MNKLLISLLCGFLIAPVYAADAPLPANLEQIETLQKRSDKLVFGDVGSENYHLAKARAWLDLALSEYHQTDTSGVMISAIEQADKLLTALENKQADISLDTPNTPPTIQGTEVVRTDLWDRVAIAKKNAHVQCGQRQLAEAEVELVWAGHEKMEAGWSHAESYGRTAEDSLYTAETNMKNCANPAAASGVAAIAPDMSRNVEKLSLSADTAFGFGTGSLTKTALVDLDKLANMIKGWSSIQSIELVGYTDRLRTDGNEAKNQELSESRAASIKQYLVGKGIPEDKIHVQGAGSSKPLVTCPADVSKAKQVVCLQPNRRVEITLHGEK